MESVSTRLADETYQDVRETSDEQDVSVAEVLRTLVERGRDYSELNRETEALRDEVRRLRDARLGDETERLARETLAAAGDHDPEAVDDLGTDAVVRALADRAADVGDLEREVERLNRERRQLLETREENKELVRYAETQRELDTRREERRDAPVWRRAKWWVLGRKSDA